MDEFSIAHFCVHVKKIGKLNLWFGIFTHGRKVQTAQNSPVDEPVQSFHRYFFDYLYSLLSGRAKIYGQKLQADLQRLDIWLSMDYGKDSVSAKQNTPEERK